VLRIADIKRLAKTYEIHGEEGEVRGFRLTIDGEKAGELVVKLQRKERTLWIQLLMVEQRYRRRGYGTELLRLAEKVASDARLSRIALRPYSLDRFHIQDSELRSWYTSRGYTLSARTMYRDVEERGEGVIA